MQKGKEMKINEQLVRNLANAANVVNTISGGSVFPTFETEKLEDHYRVEVSVPSIDPDDIKVEVKNNSLLIMHHLQLDDYKIPNMLGVLTISADVILEDIHAEYSDEKLVVILPYSEMFGGFNREIEIHRS